MSDSVEIQNILVASRSQKHYEYFSEVLLAHTNAGVQQANNAALVRRKTAEQTYDLIIIDAPLCDEFGYELAADIISTDFSSVILTVNIDAYDEIAYKLEPLGVLVLSKPLSKTLFTQTLRHALATRQRLKLVDQRRQSLEDKLEEMRLINRAKLILIESQGMAESEAHRHIEKQAMDTRRSKKEVALIIIEKQNKRKA